MSKIGSDSGIPDLSAFSEWAGEADCISFDGPRESVIASIRQSLRPHHMRYLEIANEENPNNARVSSAKNKGYIQCLEFGWLEEKVHPVAGYSYFALTELGEVAARVRPEKQMRRRVRIACAPPRLASAPPRLPTTLPRR